MESRFGGDKFHENMSSSSRSRSRPSSSSTSICEIEEEGVDLGVRLPSIHEDHESSAEFIPVQPGYHATGREDDDDDDDDKIYVAVGTGNNNDETSMEALSWTLNNAVSPSTLVYLIHVYPEIKYIPSPLGMLPKNQVRQEQLEKYMAKEESKRRELLQKFFNACSTFKVKVDTVVIESDMVANSILDLIPILNIKKLVLGITKSGLRKVKSRRGSGINGQILQNAPETCEIKIVCEGKEVRIDEMTAELTPPSSVNGDQSPEIRPPQVDQINGSFSCMCFKPKFTR